MVDDYKGYIDGLEPSDALVFCLGVAAQWISRATAAALELKDQPLAQATTTLGVSTLQLKDLAAVKYGDIDPEG